MENKTEKMDSLDILGALAEVEGPCSVHEGMLWLEDGTTFDLTVVAKSRAGYLTELRLAGYAVVIFSPEELGTADPRVLQNRLVELGNEAITDLQENVSIESPKG